MAERVEISAGPLTLEGLLEKRPGGKGVVVAHPHPLYGGNMHNTVVKIVADSYARAGYSALRFNFRGVGASEGVYADGEGEKEDVLGAVKVLKDEGAESIHLAGYSFGSWVNAGVMHDLPEVETVVMVSPPVNAMDFSFLGLDRRIRLVVTGDRDDIAGATLVKSMIPRWNPDAGFHVIEGCDHFYWGREGILQSILDDFLRSLPGDTEG